MEVKMSKHYYHLAEICKCFLLLILSIALFSCATKTSMVLDARFQKDLDKTPIPIPEETEPGEFWDHLYNKSFRHLYRMIDIPAWSRSFGYKAGIIDEKQAENVNAWDEVPDSTWFTNRIGKFQLSVDEIKTGAKSKPGPDISKSWQVIQGKSNGVTAGFTIKDVRGDMYFVKFDPPKLQEIASAAEIISSLILHSAGYNVPAYYALSVPLDIFILSNQAKIKGKYGVKRKMTDNDLKSILKNIETDDQGLARVSASLALEGHPIGPFLYEGTRKDDINDKIAHQHRRELRGYSVFGAWLNNSDLRFQNTLDMYIGKPGKGYVQHNMLDFGTSLGAAGNSGKTLNTGYEALLDYSEIGKNLASLGFREPYWMNVKKSEFSSVGIFESDIFDPLRWRTQYNNLAFDLMTDRDAFWAAKIIMKFHDEFVTAIVKEAKYSNPKAEVYMIETLKQRRDKIGKAWFKRTTPLDDFSLQKRDNKWVLHFIDLAVKYNLALSKDRTYDTHINEKSNKLRVDPEGNGSLIINEMSGNELNQPITINIQFNVKHRGEKIGKGVITSVVCQKSDCVISGLKRS